MPFKEDPFKPILYVILLSLLVYEINHSLVRVVSDEEILTLRSTKGVDDFELPALTLCAQTISNVSESAEQGTLLDVHRRRLSVEELIPYLYLDRFSHV